MMHQYGWYVWSAYAITFGGLVWLVLGSVWEMRSVQQCRRYKKNG